MGPLSELAIPLEQGHPNPVNNLAGARHSDAVNNYTQTQVHPNPVNNFTRAQVHPNPVNNPSGTRHSDRTNSFYRYGGSVGTGLSVFVGSGVPKCVVRRLRG